MPTKKKLTSTSEVSRFVDQLTDYALACHQANFNESRKLKRHPGKTPDAIVKGFQVAAAIVINACAKVKFDKSGSLFPDGNGTKVANMLADHTFSRDPDGTCHFLDALSGRIVLLNLLRRLAKLGLERSLAHKFKTSSEWQAHLDVLDQCTKDNRRFSEGSAANLVSCLDLLNARDIKLILDPTAADPESDVEASLRKLDEREQKHHRQHGKAEANIRDLIKSHHPLEHFDEASRSDFERICLYNELQKARHDPTNFRSEKELVRRALSEHPSAFMTRTGIRRVMTFESAYRDYRDWKDGNGYWRKHAKDMRADVYAKFQR